MSVFHEGLEQVWRKVFKIKIKVLGWSLSHGSGKSQE